MSLFESRHPGGGKCLGVALFPVKQARTVGEALKLPLLHPSLNEKL
jgi:hypothetical protein